MKRTEFDKEKLLETKSESAINKIKIEISVRFYMILQEHRKDNNEN